MYGLILTLLACSVCLAHYRGGYESRNIIEREEPLNYNEGITVPCPVCENTDLWLPSSEECNLVKGGKKYKRCKLGTYVNDVCGDRLDCYRGPGERCTEKMDVDRLGERCAPGYYCNKAMGVCTGMDFIIDSNELLLLNPNRFPLRERRYAY